MISRVVGGALLLFSLSDVAHAQSIEVAPLRALLGPARAETVPGCALGVYRNGKLETWTAAGHAQLDAKLPITDQTVFYAASISKQFTALAAVQLHLAGKLDLDGDIRQWLPDFHRHSSAITPRMLLTHTSGVLDSMSLRKLDGKNIATEATWQRLIRQPVLNFAPGTDAFYSNGGYQVLAELVQQASGQRFAAYLEDNILAPLGMRDTYMLDGDHRPSPHLAFGYSPRADGYAERATFPRSGGAGGLMLSLRDLERYEFDIERGGKVWTPAVRALMEAPGRFKDGRLAVASDRPGALKYAMGLMVDDRDGRRYVQHGGILQGFQHMYVRSPEHSTAVAVLCNDGSSASAHRAHAAMDLLIGPAPAKLADAPIAGIYHAETLTARYVISRSSQDSLTLAILGEGEATPSEVIEMTREGKSTRFKGGGVYVAADGGQGIEIGTDRAKGLRAKRR